MDNKFFCRKGNIFAAFFSKKMLLYGNYPCGMGKNVVSYER